MALTIDEKAGPKAQAAIRVIHLAVDVDVHHRRAGLFIDGLHQLFVKQRGGSRICDPVQPRSHPSERYYEYHRNRESGYGHGESFAHSLHSFLLPSIV